MDRLHCSGGSTQVNPVEGRIADDGDVVDEQGAVHEVGIGQAVLVEVMPPEIVHRYHQTAELDFWPSFFVRYPFGT